METRKKLKVMGVIPFLGEEKERLDCGSLIKKGIKILPDDGSMISVFKDGSFILYCEKLGYNLPSVNVYENCKNPKKMQAFFLVDENNKIDTINIKRKTLGAG